jgi:outer membrane protein
MRKTLLALTAIAALAPQFAAAQDSGDWIVRGRALHLQSANGNSAQLRSTLNNVSSGASDSISLNDKWMPEVDISYFLTPNIAAELILTYPQKHTVTLDGVGKIGSLKHLPPTLTAQYHFTQFGSFRPYLGAGVNYTNISDVHVLGGAVNVKRDSFGLALQAGVDVPMGNGWLLNFDVKKVQIQTDVLLSASDTKVGTFKVNPLLVSIGFGKRF